MGPVYTVYTINVPLQCRQVRLYVEMELLCIYIDFCCALSGNNIIACSIVAIFGTLFAIVIGCSLCIICYLKRFGFPKHLFVGAAAPPTIEAVRAVEATPNNYDITDTVMMKMERYNRSFSVDDDIKYNVDSPPAYRNFIETPSSLQTDV